ncbi:unnamed protein product, partial [Allacma fusca]
GTPVPLLQYDYAGSTISISAQLEEKSIKEKCFSDVQDLPILSS